jgi:hypothetical protein
MIKVTTEVVDRSTIFVLTQPNIDDKHRSLVNKLGHPKTLQEISGVYFALADKDARGSALDIWSWTLYCRYKALEHE